MIQHTHTEPFDISCVCAEDETKYMLKQLLCIQNEC